jgi:hypothetical protein
MIVVVVVVAAVMVDVVVVVEVVVDVRGDATSLVRVLFAKARSICSLAALTFHPSGGSRSSAREPTQPYLVRSPSPGAWL